jgi:serine/threonine protein kinase
MELIESAVTAEAPAPLERKRRAATVVREAGDRIAGKYVLVRLLGEGGMGTVWHARNLAFGADVAIKLLLPERVTEEASERLLREARATALIDHPSIVRVFDFGRTEENEPFIVMELLRGTPLSDLFDSRGKIPAKVAVQLLLPVISAVAAAHAEGVIHRDLKPDNVMLTVTSEGCVLPKVVDFGIAKLTRETRGRSITIDGAVLGSPDYMAPEQARGAAGVDERADVWALCVMLYEAITGFRPFASDNCNALLYAILTEDPIPTTEFAAGDADLWAILQRGLEKSVDKRWSSMHTLGVALAQWLADHNAHVDVTGGDINHRWLSPGRLSAALDLPALSAKVSPLVPTQWASHTDLPGLGQSQAADSKAVPPSSPLRRRLAVLAAAVAVLIVTMGGRAWLSASDSAGAPQPTAALMPFTAAGRALKPFDQPRPEPPMGARPAAEASEPPTVEPAGSVATTVVRPPSPANASAPPFPAGARASARPKAPRRAMPLPDKPNF